MRKTIFDFVDDGVEDRACTAGETFRRRFRFLDRQGRNISLDGWTARMQARVAFDSEEALFTLTTENDGLVIDMEEPEDSDDDNEEWYLAMYISAADTAGFEKGKYKYDLELIAPSGDVGKPLSGKFQVKPEITKDD